MPTIRERLHEFYRRVGSLARAPSAEEALKQLARVLDDVEDELSGIPKKSPPPPPSVNDGRMYPPLDDFIIRHPDGRITARTRRHRIEIEANGSVTIINERTGAVELSK